jgi:hypothetical protein
VGAHDGVDLADERLHETVQAADLGFNVMIFLIFSKKTSGLFYVHQNILYAKY